MKTFALTVLIPVILGGCAFFSKEVTLSAPEPGKPPNDILDGKSVSIRVKDARQGDRKVIGGAGLGFSSVTTGDDVASWISNAVKQDIIASGAEAGDKAPIQVNLEVRELETSLGMLCSISSKIKIRVEVLGDGKRLMSGEFAEETPSFCILNTSSAYEGALSDALAAWREKYMPQIRKAINKYEGLLPIITIVSPENGSVLFGSEAEIALKVENAEHLLSISVFVNEQKTNEITASEIQAETKCRVALKPWMNTILVAGNRSGKEPVRAQLCVQRRLPLPEGRKILAIGVSEFEHLPSASPGEKNARDFAACMQAAGSGSTEPVALLAGKDATFRKIILEIEKTCSKAAADGEIVIFYGGQAVEIGGKPVLAAYDTQADKELSAVAVSDIIGIMDQKFNGKRVLLIISSAMPEESVWSAVQTDVSKNDSLGVVFCGKNLELGSALSEKADSDGDGRIQIEEFIDFLGKSGEAPKTLGNIEKFIIR
jgi:hypothetical protein